jgi:membrane-associated phospholipid phosphatase
MLPGSAWAWWPLAGIIAISRVYIGVHWPTDVIAGLVVGLGISWLVLGGKARSYPHLRRSALQNTSKDVY